MSESNLPPFPSREEGRGGTGRVGEIVEASSRALTAQSVRLHDAPAFGSLVRVPVGPPPRSGENRPPPPPDPGGRQDDGALGASAGGSSQTGNRISSDPPQNLGGEEELLPPWDWGGQGKLASCTLS